MSRPIAFATAVVATVLALGAPAGAADPELVYGVPAATEPTAAAIAAVVLGAVTILAAIVIIGRGAKQRS